MGYEIHYTTAKHDCLIDYCKTRGKINLQTDCFVFFYIGNKLDESFPTELQCYQFIKQLENQFNVNINWINLSWVFDKLVNQYKDQDFKLNDSQMQLLLNQFKVMYHISLNDYCRKVIKT